MTTKMVRMRSKFYSIKGSRDYFRTGVSSIDGTQILCGRQGNSIVCLKFSADGKFIGSQTALLSNPGDDEVTSEEIASWAEQNGYNPGTIRVHKFVVPDRTIGIRDFPDYLQEYIDYPTKFSKDRQEHLSRCVDEWVRSGNYVLIWNEDYEEVKRCRGPIFDDEEVKRCRGPIFDDEVAGG